MACSATFLINQGPFAEGWHCTIQQVGGPFHIKYTLRKYPIELPTGQCDGGMVSADVSSSQMTLAVSGLGRRHDRLHDV